MVGYRHILSRFSWQLGMFWLVLSGCEKEAVGPGEGAAVRFRGEHEAVVRTTAGGEKWLDTDRVGIFLVKTGALLKDGAVAGADNVKYRVVPDAKDARVATFTPEAAGETIYFPGGKVDAVAYYPWRKAPDGGDPYTLVMEVTDQRDPAAIDVQYAKTVGVDKRDAEVRLAFGHVLSKVVLNVKAGPGVAAGTIRDGAWKLITMKGVYGSATLSLSDGTLTPDGLANGSFRLYREGTTAGGYDAMFSAIVVPQGARGGRMLEFTVDGETYACEIPADMVFEKGTCYTFNVTIDRTVTIGTATITPWVVAEAPVVEPVRESGIHTAAHLVAFSAEWNAATTDAARASVIEKWSGMPRGTVCLRADIDMAGVDFTPIGADRTNPFTGTFDGRGHVISNLTVNSNSEGGLFGNIGRGTIRDVKLVDCKIESPDTDAGGIAGHIDGVTIEGCSVTGGKVNGLAVGGICGVSFGTITGCSVTDVTVNGTMEGGGISGYSVGTITGCSVIGVTVYGGMGPGGGICGYADGGAITAGCIANPTKVTGGEQGVGVGNNFSSGPITACYGIEIAGVDAGGFSPFKREDVTDDPRTNFFTKKEAPDGMTPIETMNAALKAAGSKWLWRAGDASSGWLPVIETVTP